MLQLLRKFMSGQECQGLWFTVVIFLCFFFFLCTIPGSGGPICAVGSIGLLCGGFIGRLTG